MVKSWGRLTDLQRRTKMYKGFLDPVYLISDPYFHGGQYVEPTPLQKEVSRRLWSPCNTVRGIPNQNIREMVVMGGMRLSKTTTAGIQAFVAMYKMHRIADKPGWTPAKEFGQMKDQHIKITNVATNKPQSLDSVFAISKAMFDSSPYFREYAPEMNIRSEEINFPRENVDVIALASKSGGAAGKTAAFFSMDEVDQFDDTEGPSGVDNVYKIMKNSTKTLYQATKGLFGKVFMISSSGLAGSKMWRLKQPAEACGGETIWMKVVLWYDEVTNPIGDKLDKFEGFDNERTTEPAKFWQRYGCDPSFASNVWIKDYDQTIRPNIQPNLPNLLQPIGEIVEEHGYATERLDVLKHESGMPIDDNAYYIIAGDPATRLDAFGIAVGHTIGEGEWHKVYKYNTAGKLMGSEAEDRLLYHIQFDGFYRFVPRESDIDAFKVRDFFLSCNYLFPLRRAMFDTLNYPILQQTLDREGLDVVQRQIRFPEAELFKNYAQFRMFTMPEYPVFTREVKEMQLKVTATTKGIDHPPKGSKDILDVAVLVITGANLIQEMPEVGIGPALSATFSPPTAIPAVVAKSMPMMSSARRMGSMASRSLSLSRRRR